MDLQPRSGVSNCLIEVDLNVSMEMRDLLEPKLDFVMH
jgi:hypothetical protein